MREEVIAQGTRVLHFWPYRTASEVLAGFRALALRDERRCVEPEALDPSGAGTIWQMCFPFDEG